MAYIVLVEDSKDVAEVLCKALRAEGHRCFVIRTLLRHELVWHLAAVLG